jgi:Zn-dependent protease
VLITQAFNDPLYYVAIVVTVVFSIVLHELAHGWAAIWQGDDTPRVSGHMDPNPLIHMGPFSIVALLLVGIAWGAMPVNPSRFRSRYGDALVAAAGPAMNLLLAIVGLTVMAVLINTWETHLTFGSALQRGGDRTLTDFQENALFVLAIFGFWNLVLMMFNLMPIPPLDGSHILANFHEGYHNLVRDPDKQGLFIMGFMLAFFLVINFFAQWALRVSNWYVGLLIT